MNEKFKEWFDAQDFSAGHHALIANGDFNQFPTLMKYGVYELYLNHLGYDVDILRFETRYKVIVYDIPNNMVDREVGYFGSRTLAKEWVIKNVLEA